MNPLAGLTMYDMLTMLTSGFLWCSLLLAGGPEYQYKSVMFWLICYIVGLVYHRFLDFVAGDCKCLRNNPKRIEKAYNKIKKESDGKLGEDFSMTNYYAAYYRLMKNNSLGNIPVLEAQVAFCRNLILILLVYLVAMSWGCGTRISILISNLIECDCLDCLMGILLTLTVGALIWVWYFTQMKIHKLVWEGSCFIKE